MSGSDAAYRQRKTSIKVCLNEFLFKEGVSELDRAIIQYKLGLSIAYVNGRFTCSYDKLNITSHIRTTKHKDYFDKLIKVLRNVVKSCGNCKQVGGILCDRDIHVLYSLFEIPVPSWISSTVRIQQEPSTQAFRKRRSAVMSQIEDFECGCDVLRKICEKCSAKASNYLKTPINNSTNLSSPVQNFIVEKLARCNDGCMSKKELFSLSGSKRMRHCQTCVDQIEPMLWQPVDRYLSLVDFTLPIIEKAEKRIIEAREKKKSDLKRKKNASDIIKLHAEVLSSRLRQVNGSDGLDFIDSPLDLMQENIYFRNSDDVVNAKWMKYSKDCIAHSHNPDKRRKEASRYLVEKWEDLPVSKKLKLFGVRWSRLQEKCEYPELRTKVKTLKVQHCIDYIVSQGSQQTTNCAANKHFYYTNDDFEKLKCQVAGIDLVDNTVESTPDGPVPRAHRNKYKYPRHFLLLPIELMYENYVKFYAENPLNHPDTEKELPVVGLWTFTRCIPFFVRAPGPSDIQHCVCSICHNWFNLRDFVVRHCGFKVDHDKLLEQADQLNDEIFENNPTITQMEEETYDFIYDRELLLNHIEFQQAKFLDHWNQLQEHQKHFKPTIDQKLDENWIFVSSDFSQNVSLLPKNRSQYNFYNDETKTLLPAVVKFRKNGETIDKSYDFIGGDFKDHPCELVAKHLAQIIRRIKTEHPDFEPAGIILASDNCASQYKSKFSIATLATLMHQFNLPIMKIWFVSMHGKGEHDGAGGTGFKCIFYRYVKAGTIVNSFAEVVKIVRNHPSKIKKYFTVVSDEEHSKFKKYHKSIDFDKYKITGISDWQVCMLKPSNVESGWKSMKLEYKNVMNVTDTDWKTVQIDLAPSVQQTDRY